MSVATRYRKNYDQIARDHVAYWRETGGNPFQGTANMKANENLTVALIEKYAPDGMDVGRRLRHGGSADPLSRSGSLGNGHQ